MNGINMMISFIEKKNPQIGSMLRQMQEGRISPYEVMQKSIDGNQLSYSQFKQFRQAYKQLNGRIPYKISDEEFDSLEALFGAKNSGSNNSFRF